MFIYVNYILQALNNGSVVHSIYTDFSKAFDRVNHSILLNKLNVHGIQGGAICWIHLTGRKLQDKVDGHISFKYNVTSVVSQGSHLGPTLFNIFVNDIGDDFQSEYLLYADDLKVFRTKTNEQDTQALQRDIDRLSTWCQVNKLDLNIKKCCAVSFSRSHFRTQVSYNLNNEIIKKADNVKDLGIIIDKLMFNKHIDKITLQAFKVLGYITRNSKDFSNSNSLLRLSSSLSLPILEYGSVIWSPFTDTSIKSIEKVQLKLCKTLEYRYGLPGGYGSSSDIYNHFKIESLQARRQVAGYKQLL